MKDDAESLFIQKNSSKKNVNFSMKIWNVHANEKFGGFLMSEQ